MRLPFDEDWINIDVFAGGGGAGEAMKDAGLAPDVALNHDREACAVYSANHPECEVFCQDVFEAKPLSVTRGRTVRSGWFSPDCTHHSKAKGGKPLDNKRRSLAWVVVDYARDAGIWTIYLENVEEFADWGPLGPDHRPIKSRRGETFTQWASALEAPYQLVDIGMRMLSLDELKLAHGLPAHFNLQPFLDGKRLTKTSAIAKVGNSVSPYPATAWIKANMPPDSFEWRATA